MVGLQFYSIVTLQEIPSPRRVLKINLPRHLHNNMCILTAGKRERDVWFWLGFPSLYWVILYSRSKIYLVFQWKVGDGTNVALSNYDMIVMSTWFSSSLFINFISGELSPSAKTRGLFWTLTD